MRPLLLKGHERPVVYLKYNRDGDLIFSASKDRRVTAWFSENGKRLGTYEGHDGAINCLDVSQDSRYLITGSADCSVRVWDVKSGKELLSFEGPRAPVKDVRFAEGDRQFLVATRAFVFGGQPIPPMICVYNFPENLDDFKAEPVLRIEAADTHSSWRVTCAAFINLNKQIVAAYETGHIRVFDTATGEEKKEFTVQAHDGLISSMSFNKERFLMLTTSADQTGKLWDVKTMKHLKTYKADVPMNTGAISPDRHHIIMGGGQEARDVTTTAGVAGKFEARFHHMVFEDELGRVKGHFGPMHSVSFHPHGTGFCTGGEDGYLRLHHFDEDYKDLGEEPELDDPNLGKVVKEVEAAVARLEREQKEAEKLINGPLPESESKTE